MAFGEKKSRQVQRNHSASTPTLSLRWTRETETFAALGVRARSRMTPGSSVGFCDDLYYHQILKLHACLRSSFSGHRIL